MASNSGKFSATNALTLAPSGLPESDAALFENMLEAWSRRRVGNNHRKKSISGDITIVREFTAFTNKAPWYWDEDDFDSWCEELGVARGLAPSSQRKYQGAIRIFLEYISNNVKFKNEVRRLYNITLKQICNEENCIPHVSEKELSNERRAFSHQQISIFFDAIDRSISEAARFNSKDLRPLQRDKVIFYTLYIGGLRISEGQGLNLESFEPNPAIPQFNDYGFIRVWGKGSRGSGKKFGQVPITHDGLPPLIDWYVKSVRPHFMMNADANENALFLSERGNRIAISTIEARFQHILRLAGLEGLGFTPHSLRHSSVTHESLRFSIEAVRRKHRHVYASTTQGYMHVPDSMVNDELNATIKAQIDMALDNTINLKDKK